MSQKLVDAAIVTLWVAIIFVYLLCVSCTVHLYVGGQRVYQGPDNSKVETQENDND